MQYRTIRAAASAEFVEKRSRFIGYISPVTAQQDAIAFIDSIKSKHWDATHNVPAYIIREGNICRFSDDGEPQGTAGHPMLHVLQMRKLTNVLAVVTRYFGGIKLGAGGLTRAYSGALSDAVKAAPIVTYTPYARYTVTLPYTAVGGFENYIKDKDIRVLDRAFTAEVQVTFLTLPEEAKTHLKFLTDLTGGKAVIEEDGEEYVKVREW